MSEKHDSNGGGWGDEFTHLTEWVVGAVVVVILAVNAYNMFAPTGEDDLTGKPVPDVELPTLDDEDRRVSPADFEGEVVVLDFWATWCPPCHRQMLNLHEFRESPELEGVDFQILSVNTDDPGEGRTSKVRTYLDERDVDPLTLLDDGRAVEKFGVQSFPTLVVVGPDGRTTHVASGVHDVETLRRYVSRAAER